MVVDIDKKIIRNVVKKMCERRKVNLLKDVMIGKRFEDKIIDLVDVVAPNLWGHFMGSVLVACDEVFCKKRCRRSK